MDYLLQQLLNGLVIGSFLALMAVGFSMTYGVIRLANFAHGDIGYMFGTYLAVSAFNAGLPILPSIIVGIALAGILGLVVVRVAYKPVLFAPRLVMLLTTLGVSIFLQNLAMILWGAQARPFPVMVDNPYVQIGSVRVFLLQGIVIATTVILAIAMYYLVHHTRMGKAMRATAEDMDTARIMGINVDRVVYGTFVLGTFLGCVAGMLAAIYYNSLSPVMGFTPTLKAFCISVLGGIGSLPGALLGGVLMGVTEALGAGYIFSGFRDGFAYLLLFAFLIFLPNGLFGKSRDRA
ncbi:MAG: branched-chain amino acid ABC transporter permease [Tetrasphaera sp.]